MAARPRLATELGAFEVMSDDDDNDDNDNIDNGNDNNSNDSIDNKHNNRSNHDDAGVVDVVVDGHRLTSREALLQLVEPLTLAVLRGLSSSNDERLDEASDRFVRRAAYYRGMQTSAADAAETRRLLWRVLTCGAAPNEPPSAYQRRRDAYFAIKGQWLAISDLQVCVFVALEEGAFLFALW
jgi:hypothetical protein